MANRKSLILALCAMGMAFGFTSCSDDSGHAEDNDAGTKEETLTLSSKTSTLIPGGNAEVMAMHSAAALTVTSATSECVEATVVPGADKGVSTIKLVAKGTDCTSEITVKGDDKSEVINASVTAADATASLKIDQGNVTMDTGETATVNATYMIGDKPGAGNVLGLTVDNENCVKLDSKQVTIDDNGKGVISMTAGDTACSAKVTVAGPADSNVEARVITVTVNESAETPVVTEGAKLEFYEPKVSGNERSVEIGGDNPSKDEFAVRMLNGDGTNVPNANIIYEISGDDKCITVANRTVKTTAEGTATNTISVGSNAEKGCSGTVTIKSKSVETPLTVTVTVSPITEYDMTVNIKMADEAKRAKVNNAKVNIIAASSCDEFMAMAPSDIRNTVDGGDFGQTAADINNQQELIATTTIGAVPVFEANTYAVVGYVDANGDAATTESNDILGFGCHEITGIDSNVDLTIEAVKTNIAGKYQLVTNIDLTSGFSKTPGDMPKAEAMAAGDWIDFVVQLFAKPIDTLFEFIWANSVKRLGDIHTDNATANNVINAVVGVLDNDVTKKMALAYLRPMLEDYLNPKQREKVDGAGNVIKDAQGNPVMEDIPAAEREYNWYRVLTKIGGDIEDLVNNMQLVGEFDIPQKNVSSESKDLVTYYDAKHAYSELHYKWSYKKKAETEEHFRSQCNTLYSDPTICRRSMKISEDSVKSDKMGGKVTFVDADGNALTNSDALMAVTPHSPTFKWVTILFSAVFGEILPSALDDYKLQTESLGGGKSKELLIKSFLYELIFEPVVNSYNKKLSTGKKDTANNCTNVEMTNDDGTKETICYPDIQSTDTCIGFIESIVYLIGKDKASGWTTGVTVVGELACNTYLNKLDDMVMDKLSVYEIDGEQGFTISTDDNVACNLYDEGTSSYVSIGQPDEKFTSAKDLLKDTIPQTNRCGWNIKFDTEKVKADVKGFFHAKRIDSAK